MTASRGRRLLVASVAVWFTALLPAGATPASGRSFEVGLIGDTGYSAGEDQQLLAVRAHMARFPLAFVVHDGDIQHGSSPPCTDQRLEYVRGVFAGFSSPLVYTPGDNEWLDCPAPANPQNRLRAIRRIFFPTDATLGRKPMTVVRQAGPWRENARWVRNGVVFATLNVPGPDGSSSTEGAALAWLGQAFDVAMQTKARGVMIIWQDDPFTDGSSPKLTAALRKRASTFGGPVVLVHGDTHVQRIDHPWRDVPNFTRVETFALAQADRWIRATVDPDSGRVFSFSLERAGPG